MIQKPKGTKDLLPEESYKWQDAEAKVKKVLESYNFKEIRSYSGEKVTLDNQTLTIPGLTSVILK